ncbi:hypothetical protein [Boseongicola sp. H5]|uniref:hypothetical protein n=1 Tax=Boseongicola sp. H5 TaxID=2763261 RepID=UPI001D0A8CCF|nr:hypothetical protein [Boseongicola sp. H5]
MATAHGLMNDTHTPRPEYQIHMVAYLYSRANAMRAVEFFSPRLDGTAPESGRRNRTMWFVPLVSDARKNNSLGVTETPAERQPFCHVFAAVGLSNIFRIRREPCGSGNAAPEWQCEICRRSGNDNGPSLCIPQGRIAP